MSTAELINISHQYGGQFYIKNFSVTFQEKKITAIIGRSGSGKSTILKFVNGLVKPTIGSITVFGSPLNYSTLSATRLRMGYMLQGTGLFPHLTIEDNISITNRITKGDINAAQRIEELLSLVRLPTALLKKYPYQLSGGEQQRAGICRALFLNPSILLMDEPFGALDPITRQEIQLEILKLQQVAARTILLVTHDMREAKKMADYILVIDNGEIQQHASTDEVLKKPSNKLVEQLIESSL